MVIPQSLKSRTQEVRTGPFELEAEMDPFGQTLKLESQQTSPCLEGRESTDPKLGAGGAVDVTIDGADSDVLVILQELPHLLEPEDMMFPFLSVFRCRISSRLFTLKKHVGGRCSNAGIRAICLCLLAAFWFQRL